MLARRLALLLALAGVALAVAPRAAMAGTLIRVIDSSSFGPVLHDGRGQAIYAFTYDRPSRSRCYGECARDWPPVKTVGRPLYFYRNEGRRQIFCQNVFSFGGRWLVVRPSGRLVR